MNWEEGEVPRKNSYSLYSVVLFEGLDNLIRNKEQTRLIDNFMFDNSLAPPPHAAHQPGHMWLGDGNQDFRVLNQDFFVAG